MLVTTKRLSLREFVEKDWQAVLAYQSRPEYLQYYAWELRSNEDAQEFVQQFITWQQEQPRTKFQFATILAAEQKLIGNCGLRLKSAAAREAELGYEIDPTVWGRGYATEAAQAMLDLGFVELGLHRVWASCLEANVASVRVLEKIGMQREGQLRENQYFKGRWWDTLIYGVLKREWEALSA